MRRRGLLPGLLLALLVSTATAEEPRGAQDADLVKAEARLAALLAKGDAPGAARALQSVAARLERLGRYEDALARYEEAVAAERDLKNASRTARMLHAQAGVLMKLGRHADAEAAYAAGLDALAALERPRSEAVLWGGLSDARRAAGDCAGALEAAERALALLQPFDEARRKAQIHSTIGVCLVGLRQTPAAKEAYQQSLDLFRAVPDARGVAHALTNLGNVNLRLGHHAEARERFEEALEIYRAHDDQPNVAVTLGNLGIVHEAARNLVRARECYAKALTLHAAVSDRRRFAAALAAAGIVDMRLRRYADALAKERRALALYEALSDAPGQVRVLVNVANIQERQGRLEAARATCDQADAILGRGAPPRARAHVLWSRARIRLAGEQPGEALAEARGAIDLLSWLTQGTDTDAAATRDVYDGLFDVSIRAAIALDEPEELAWVLEQSRAVVLRDSLAARCSVSATDVSGSLCRDVTQARTARRDATERFWEARAGGVLSEVQRAKQGLEAANGAYLRVMHRVELASKAAAALLNTEPNTLEQLQAQVAPDEVLVLYGLAEDQAVALLLRPGKADDAVRTVRLGPLQPILDAVDALGADDRKRTVAEVDAATKALRALLTRRLALPADVRRVLVSPAGPLGFVPFGLLFPDLDVAYVPSGTTYGQLRGGGAPRGQGILALGDPSYRDGSRLSRLPDSKPEVEQVGTVQLLGEAATKSGLVEALGRSPRWRAVHFACHGLVDREKPMLSSLALSADDESDGLLTCSEIVQLRIPADLVVLSACETGLGRIYRTEGIFGLTRAFLFAGADRVLSSLWVADDGATRALMVRFYELWNGEEGCGAAEALRRAQEHVRTRADHPEWAHPFYWAGWVLWGLPD